MQVILILLISFAVSAQEVCDPREAAKECFSQLCIVPTDNLLLQNGDDLLKAIRKIPTQKLPDKVMESINLQLVKIDKIKTFAKAIIDKNEVPKLAEKLLGEASFGENFLERFYYGSLKCAGHEFPCNIIKSDMDSVPAGVENAFKKISDYASVKRSFRPGLLSIQKEYLFSVLSMIKVVSPDTSIEKERTKINSFKSQSEFQEYHEQLMKDFDALVSKDLARFKNDLISGITQRTKELLSIDHSKDKLIESCLLADHLRKELSKKASEEKFKADVESVLNSVKEKFSSKLSPESSKSLDARLDVKYFHLVRFKPDGIITSPEDLKLSGDFKFTEQNSDSVLQELPKYTSSGKFGCDLASMYPSDRYENLNINISEYSIAHNGKEIIAHEIGHLMSEIMNMGKLSQHSLGKLLSARNCVQNYYPKDFLATGGFSFVDGDRQTSSEDFADWFAAQLNIDGGTFCELENLVSKGKTNNLFMIEKGSSVHSASLFRELNIRINKGEKIPKSCQDLLDAHPDINIKKCNY